MPQSKRSLQATAALTTSPPTTLPSNHAIARVTRLAGNNLYQVEFGTSSASTKKQDSDEVAGGEVDEGLVELPSRFRNAIWLKRGSYVVVDTLAMGERENKLRGEIVNVVREERAWRRMAWWPKEFVKKEVPEDSDEEESVVGKMPPSDSEEE